LAAYVREMPADQLAAQLADGQAPVAGWQGFCERFQAYLRDYGHIIYNLDYARPLPLDDATPMLETTKMYLRGQGVNPHERQRAAEDKRVQAAEATLQRLKGLRRWAFGKTLGMAQTMAAVRENALSDIGLGYPLLRAMLRELGCRLAQAGGIAQNEDIFWLQADELRQAIAALERGEPLSSLAERISQRQATHEALKRVTPPPMLPPKKKYMGIDMAAFTPATAESQTGGTLKGIGASAGLALLLPASSMARRISTGCALATCWWPPPRRRLDAALCDGVGGRHRHRRAAQSWQHRRPRVWHPRRDGHGRRHQAHPQRADHHRGRQRRHRHTLENRFVRTQYAIRNTQYAIRNTQYVIRDT